MTHQKLPVTKRIAAFTAAFMFALTGVAFLGTSGNASAAAPGFNVRNNCGKTATFGYNKYNTPAGTGAYHQVSKGATYRVTTSSTGIFRVEMPKGTFNILVYSGTISTINMCN